MARRRKNGRAYLKSGRYYGDFRDLGGRLEALIPAGEKRATTDPDVAAALVAARVKELESIKRGLAIVGVGKVPLLAEYAAYHLKRKKMSGKVTDWTLGGVQRCLERAVEYFGANKRASPARRARCSATSFPPSGPGCGRWPRR